MHEGLLFIAVGAVGLLLPLSAAYRGRLVRTIAEQAQVRVPAEQAAALEARETRRALAGGVGVVVAGVILVVLSLAGVDLAMFEGWFSFALLLTVASACLAVVEILRPGAPTDGPRFARLSSPVVGDYLSPKVLLGVAGVVALAVVVTAASLLLGRTPWFDAQVLRSSPLPLLAVALPVLAGLGWWAVQRLLDAPQPARDETELYWQDAVRSSTITTLAVPPAVIAVLGLLASGDVLDEAASVATARSGSVGPDWTVALLVMGYAAPFVLLLALILLSTRWFGGSSIAHMRDRLWGGRVPGASGAEALPGDGRG
ncbi:hypothetical protein [Ornithinimicrobium panacihumi]|uniref:hypothetical protein n=1 Tax=Ornithinimicrobium panacihumi TaxID=2008449 RepID=UPI003F885F86